MKIARLKVIVCACLLGLSLYHCSGGSGSSPAAPDTTDPGNGNPPSTSPATDNDRDGHIATTAGGDDCNDDDATIFSNAAETCDGKDNDCNDQIDEGVKTTYYQDSDGDGFGNGSATTQACALPAGYVANGTDCSDTNATINTSAAEICDDIDNNCDGQIDEGTKITYYQDSDGDNSGNPAVSAQACTPPVGYVATRTDCNDADATIFPTAQEICDTLDNNCNGQIDEGLPATLYYQDSDSDTYGNPAIALSRCSQPSGYVGDDTDCDDIQVSVNPGATEVLNGFDDDCDGLIDIETDNGGWNRTVSGAVISQGATGAPDVGGDDQPSILYNAVLNLYQIWFRMITLTQPDGTILESRIGYAESSDGLTWTNKQSVLQATPTLAWESGNRLGFPSVIYRNGTYEMWYQAQDSSNKLKIAYATSNDGITWTKSANNPVLIPTAGTWDKNNVQAPSVLYNTSSNRYEMWYTGSDGTFVRTGFATSTNGFTWTKNSSYVLSVGESGAWDAKRVAFARVHIYEDKYHMWYSGLDAANRYQIGYAFSEDGLNWTKQSVNNAVFSYNPDTGNFDSQMVYAADVIAFDSRHYAMFYSGQTINAGPYAIGIALADAPNP